MLVVRNPLRLKRHFAGDGTLLLCAGIFDDERAVTGVLDTGRAELHLSVIRGEPLKLWLRPFRKRMIVALSAINPQSKQRSPRSCRQSLCGPVAKCDLQCHKRGCRAIREDAVTGDHLASDLTIGHTLLQRLSQPAPKSLAAGEV